MSATKRKILTIIVPAYNMERCLAKNLNTYTASNLRDKISVIVLDNNSSDSTLEIARSFEDRYPEVFRVITKENNGYGSSVNMGMSLVDSEYFRVIDADDFVEADALLSFVMHLSECTADIVQTPYVLVDMKSGQRKRVSIEAEFGETKPIFSIANQSPVPSLHTTTLKTDFVKANPFTLLENAYYVDEELVLYPFFYATTFCAYDDAVYCYVVNNDSQSISVENKVKNRSHRDRIIKRMMQSYTGFIFKNENSDFCYRRVAKSVGDHFTTLYILNSDKKEGRKEAKELALFIKGTYPQFYSAIRKKRILLSILNRFHISISLYEKLKKFLGYKEHSSLC